MSNPSDRLQQVAHHLSPTTTPEPASSLTGKVCIITGAGSTMGIGRATAWAYAQNGAKAIYMVDIAGDMEGAAREIQQAHPGTQVIGVLGDASSEKDTIDLIDRVMKEQGRLDVFFANAGIATASRLPKTSLETFSKVMRINAESVFLALKHAGVRMAEGGGGSIILTASVAGVRSGAGSLEYSASKAAVVSMAQTGSTQLAGTNVRVNAICPGLIETNMTKVVFDGARKRNTVHKVGQLNPMMRYGHAKEIASVALFLAGGMSSYVNGQAICVDGGLSASHPVVPGKFF